MGFFITDHNISTGPVGSKASTIGGASIDRSTVNLSTVEQSTGEISKSSEMTTLDLADIFGEAPKAATTEAKKVVEENVNLEQINTNSSEVSAEKLTEEATKTENINQTTGEINKETSLEGTTTVEGNKTSSGNTGGTGGGNFSVSGGAGGSGGGSWGSSSGGNTGGKVSSKVGGLQGVTTGIAGRGGGANATGAKVSGKTMQSSRPVITTGNIDRSGARMTSLPFTEEEAGIVWDSMKNTGARIAGRITGFIREKINLKSFAATAAIVVSSVVFKLLQMIEVLVDGVDYYVAALEDLVGLEEDAQRRREGIAVDNAGDLEKKLYEETALGKAINEASIIKYDGLVAKGIKKFTGTIVKMAAVLGLGPGGAAAIGFFVGTGEAAQSAYSNALANGNTDLDLGILGNAGIVLSGGLGALEWYSYKGPAEGLGNIIEGLSEAGGREYVLSEIGKQFFSKETIEYIKDNWKKNAFKSFLQSTGDIGKIISKYMNGEKVTAKDYDELLQGFIINFGINSIIGRTVNIIGDYKVYHFKTYRDRRTEARIRYDNFKEWVNSKLKGRNVSKDAKKAREVYETVDEHDRELRRLGIKVLNKLKEAFLDSPKHTVPFYESLSPDEKENTQKLVRILTGAMLTGGSTIVPDLLSNSKRLSGAKAAKTTYSQNVVKALADYETLNKVSSAPEKVREEKFKTAEAQIELDSKEESATKSAGKDYNVADIPRLGNEPENKLNNDSPLGNRNYTKPVVEISTNNTNVSYQQVDISSGGSSEESPSSSGNSSSGSSTESSSSSSSSSSGSSTESSSSSSSSSSGSSVESSSSSSSSFGGSSAESSTPSISNSGGNVESSESSDSDDGENE